MEKQVDSLIPQEICESLKTLASGKGKKYG